MIENLFANKKTLGLILALLFVAFFFLVFTLFFKQPSSTTVTQPTPTPASVYNPDNLNQDYNRISKAKANPLSKQDESVKEKLLSSIGNKSGIVYQNQNFSIEYVATANEFMIDILESDADQGKKDSEKWLTDQGLSQQGICNLPIVYYLGGSAVLQYRKENKEFNPIPDGC